MRARGPFRRVLRRVTPGGRWRYVLEARNAAACGVRAVAYAAEDVGYTEEPEHNKNDNKYGRYWNENFVPWCGLAVAFWWVKSGFDVTRALALQIDYVPEFVRLGRARLHGLFVVGKNRVRRGDAVCLRFSPNSPGDHVELFDRWIDKRRGDFATKGGNTSKAGSQDNGGAVCSQIRNTAQVVAFVRMGRVIR
jgi:hypothetical protein